jgi:hypothetical protein
VHTIKNIKIDEFTFGYLTSAIKSSKDARFEPESLDKYTPYNFSEDALKQAVDTCKVFRRLAQGLLPERTEKIYPNEGHDFWNGYDLWLGQYSEESKELAEICRVFREKFIWINDQNELELEYS